MTKMFKTAAVAAALAASTVIAPQAAFAQATLVVDIEQLYKDSAAAKNGGQQLEAKYGARLKGLQATLEAAIKGWNDQVEAAKKVQKPDGTFPPANEQALGQARQTLNDAKSAFDAAREEIQYVSQYVQAQILDKLGPIAENIRKTRRGDTVVPRGAVLAFDPANDITPAVLQQLNATLTTVSITPPQQQQQQPPAQGAAPAQGSTPRQQPPKQQPQTR